MKRAGVVLAFLTVGVVALIAGTIYHYRDSVNPGFIPATITGFTWWVATPESQGMDTEGGRHGSPAREQGTSPPRRPAASKVDMVLASQRGHAYQQWRALRDAEVPST